MFYSFTVPNIPETLTVSILKNQELFSLIPSWQKKVLHLIWKCENVKIKSKYLLIKIVLKSLTIGGKLVYLHTES